MRFTTKNYTQHARTLALSAMVLLMFSLSHVRAYTGIGDTNRGGITISLITYAPGSEVYEVFGHTELRVRTDSTDVMYNYGIFDFNSPGFVARFVAGETDYLCAAIPAGYELHRPQGREMVEQVLNLDSAEARYVANFLANNALPENATYRYKFVSDNCATRVRDIIEQAIHHRIKGSPAQHSYRGLFRAYTENYSWERFGIDLVMGRDMDTTIDVHSAMFVPMVLRDELSRGTRADGRPLVRETNILIPGDPKGTILPPTPWYASPWAFAVVILFIAAGMTYVQLRHQKRLRLLSTLLYIPFALAGTVLFYLAFFSTHEGVQNNYNLLWLNPLYFLPIVLVWFPSAAKLLRIYHLANLVLLCSTVPSWLIVGQEPNRAFFPLILALILRSVPYMRKTNR